MYEKKRLDKLLKISAVLPEVQVTGRERLHERGRGGGCLRFAVRKKTVAYYLNDHHGDGIISLCCKTTPLDQADLVEQDPELYCVPAYIGSRGWVGLRMDLRRLDWSALTELLFESYRLQAAKRLVRQFDEGEG